MRSLVRLAILCAVAILGSTNPALSWTHDGGHGGHRFGSGGSAHFHAPRQFQGHPQSFHNHPRHGSRHRGSPVWPFGYGQVYPFRFYAPAAPYAYPYRYSYPYPYSYSYPYLYPFPYYGSYMGSFGSPYLGAPSSSGDRDAYAGEGGSEPPATRAADGSWFYCRALREYYPDVKRCPEPWLEVPSTPPTR
jgi:hypothetical protein